MAILSKGIKLSYKTGSAASYVELTNLQSIPDLGAEPEKVDVTTLADSSRCYIDGIKDYGSLSFGFIYDGTQFNTIKNTLEGSECEWKIEFAKASSSSTAGASFTFSGYPTAIMVGAGVNEALTYNVSINLSSDIEYTAEA